jgi:hypothetical protein
MSILTCVDLHDYFRDQVVDAKEPFLWSNDEVYQYMDDAQNMFCRLVQGISDSSTTAIVDIPVVASAPFVLVDPRVLKIRLATRDYDFMPLAILNFEDIILGTYQKAPDFHSDYGLTGRQYKIDDTVGRTTAIISGMEPDKLRLIPISDTNFTIKLTVYREPINSITTTYATTVPYPALEIDKEHRLHLVEWMKYHAYRKQDADAFDKTKAEEARASFMAYCDLAKKEKDTREAKYRHIRYGGI